MKHYRESNTIEIFSSPLVIFKYGNGRMWRYFANWTFHFKLNKQVKRKAQWCVITPFFRSVRHNMATELGLGNHYFCWSAI